VAITVDRYNPCALVNKGNCAFVNGEIEKAAELFQEALEVNCRVDFPLFSCFLTRLQGRFHVPGGAVQSGFGSQAAA
jgi:intraflagellar transport protein 88